MSRFGFTGVPFLITSTVIVALSLLPANKHPNQTLIAGFVGVGLYIFVHVLSEIFSKTQKQKQKIKAQTGLVAFTSFLYLELLDASFSLDGVIGAFAVTNQVLLIAAGLGIGAIWVRSLTIFMKKL
jgi:hypothetical protein